MSLFYEGSPKRILKGFFKDINLEIFATVLLICSIGAIAMLSVSPASGGRINVDHFYFFNRHIVFIGICICVSIFFSIINEKWILWISILGLAMSILLLVLVFLIGADIKGSRRWLSFIGLTLQPSEIAKPFFAVVNAFVLSNFKRNSLFKMSLSSFILFVLLMLIVFQPDIGMGFIYLFCWAVQIFLSGISLGLIFVISFLLFLFLVFCYLFFDHFATRVNNFVASNVELGYQARKSIQSIAEGGIFGKGPGEGTVKFELPDSHTDYIFATIGEEFGYIVCLGILMLYFYLMMKIFIVATGEVEERKRNTIFGLLSIIFIQFFVNISVNLNCLPSKGMVLPFVSYGGSSMLGMGCLVGIILGLSRRKSGYNSVYHNINTIG